jgi:predicted PurR-regulated permease PerM
VGLTLAQFGSLQWAFLALVLLMAVQTYVGNILEPRMIGKSVNLSSFVVLVALVFWTTIWGLPGAILSIPLTSVLVILLAENPSTRPLAIMFTSDGDL